MRVAVFLTTPRDVYSGGRYCAFMFAEALAHAGNDTHIVAENEPVFLHDFEVLPSHDKVQFCRTQDFRSDLPQGRFDIVILVPGTGFPGFYLRVQRFAIERGAHLVFLNFESPNWFNALSPDPRPESEWAPWKRWSRDASLVLSISKEGQRWAEKFYTGVSAQTRFDYAYPAINTAAADTVPQGPREERLLLFIRFRNAKHKGSDRIDELFCEAMRNHTLVLVLGRSDMPAHVLEKLTVKAKDFGVEIELRKKLSDREKFNEIKRAKLVLFPSLFEGFGYPPVEALYCNTPCVAFDLPVLHETCGDRLVFAAHNNWEDFRAKIAEALDAGPTVSETQRDVEALVGIDALAARLNEALGPLLEMPPVDEARRASRKRWLRLRDTLGLNDPKSRYLRLRSRARSLVYKAAGTFIRTARRRGD